MLVWIYEGNNPKEPRTCAGGCIYFEIKVYTYVKSLSYEFSSKDPRGIVEPNHFFGPRVSLKPLVDGLSLHWDRTKAIKHLH